MRKAWAAAILLWTAPAWAGVKHEPILGVAVEERVDTEGAAGGGTELMSKLSPEVGWSAKGEALTLDASYAVDAIHHLRARNVTFDHRVRLDLKNRLTERLTLRTTGALYRVEDMASLPRFGVARVLAPALWAWAEVGLEGRLTHTLMLEGAYHGEASRIFGGGYPLGSSHAGWARLRWQVDRRLELGARVRAELFAAGAARYADALSPTLTGRWAMTRHSFVSLEGGPLVYRSKTGDTLIPRALAEVGYDARGLLLGVAATHDVVGAAGYAAAVWVDSVSAALTWRFAPTWSGWLVGGLYRNGLAPAGGADATGVTGTVGLEWRFARGFAAAATYDRIEQFAAAQGFGLSRDIVSLRVGYRTP